MTEMDLLRLKANAAQDMDAVEEAVNGALKGIWTSLPAIIAEAGRRGAACADRSIERGDQGARGRRDRRWRASWRGGCGITPGWRNRRHEPPLRHEFLGLCSAGNSAGDRSLLVCRAVILRRP